MQLSRFRILMGAAILSIVVSYAQTLHAAPPPFRPPGGLDAGTMVGSQTLFQMQSAITSVTATANGAVQQTLVGAAGGVAALNAQGRITAPSIGDVTLAAVTPAGGTQTTLGSYLGAVQLQSGMSAYLTTVAAAQTYATITGLQQVQATASAAIPTTAIGANNGVAGLNAAGQITAPVIGDLTGATAKPTGGTSVNLGDALASYATLTALTTEGSRAMAAESALQSNLNTEVTARSSGDALLCAKTGCAFTGSVTSSASISASTLTAGGYFLSGATGTSRPLHIQTAGLDRWVLSATATPELGSGVGSDLVIARYDDTGAWVDNPITIGRVSGVVNFSQVPEMPTPALADSSNSAATTGYVQGNLANYLKTATAQSMFAPVSGAVSGTGNAYACFDSTGALYRSSTACQ